MAFRYRGEVQWRYPNKCRCGKWLYGQAKERGHCDKCGPLPAAKPDLSGHKQSCAMLVGRGVCTCGAEVGNEAES